MFVSPQKSYVETLTPNEMASDVGPLGGEEVLRVKPSGMGSVPWLRTPGSALSLLPHEDSEPGSRSSPDPGPAGTGPLHVQPP